MSSVAFLKVGIHWPGGATGRKGGKSEGSNDLEVKGRGISYITLCYVARGG